MFKRIVGGYLPPYKDQHGHVIPDSISTVEKITLGGVEQGFTMRGRNKNLPILFFIHGGPGCSQTGAQRKYNVELEEHFIVVNWDQRGSGKSYDPNISPESMNIHQLLSDAYELLQYILNKFNQEKAFIMGHSVGAALGLLFCHRYPEVVKAYVGVNQPVERKEEEIKSYQTTMEIAKRNNNQKAIQALEKIGAPINGLYKNTDDLVVQRTWLTKFNGVTHKMNANKVNMHYLLSSHFTLKERVSFMKGMGFTFTHIWDEVTSLNFFDIVPEIKVPVYFIAGKHDRIVFVDSVERYFNFIKAPYKKLFVFEESAHYALFEEKDKFNNIMITQVLVENVEDKRKTS